MVAVGLRLLTGEDAQAMTEYALILAWVALVAVLAVSQLSEPISSMFTRVIGSFGEDGGPLGTSKLAPAGNWDHSPALFKT